MKKKIESQTKLFNIKLNDVQNTIDGVSDKLEMFNTQSAFGNLQNTEGASRAWRIEEIQFNNDETQIVVIAKLFLDMIKV